MIRRPPRSTLSSSSAASDVYKRQVSTQSTGVEKRAMAKRKREADFVEKLAAALLAQGDHHHASESKLREYFLTAVSGLPDSKLQDGLHKRASQHARTLFDQLSVEAAQIAPAPKKRAQREKPRGMTFLEEGSVESWLEGVSRTSTELCAAAGASSCHPALVAQLGKKAADPVAEVCHASFLRSSAEGSHSLLDVLLSHIQTVKGPCARVTEFEEVPEWKLYMRCFQVLSMWKAQNDGQPIVPIDPVLELCAQFIQWCVAVSPEAALPRAVVLCGLHLAACPEAVLALLLDERVPCESDGLCRLAENLTLPASVDIETYKLALKLAARMRERKAKFSTRGHLSRVVGSLRMPTDLDSFAQSKKLDSVLSMSEDALDQLFDMYEEERGGDDEQEEAAGGFFIDTGVQEATLQLGKVKEDEGLGEEEVAEMESELVGLQAEDEVAQPMKTRSRK
eukprot:TRINITY_DN24543_c0_g1_i11.p1 TRINITY_DN24543_c0_g1~~TRINITY_DN24543_c0_g1_i11.p1  ORF type:complete len:452 (+),score=110.27 TRINITY_DN24543_c0_g1_i11:111-1466(+)